MLLLFGLVGGLGGSDLAAQARADSPLVKPAAISPGPYETRGQIEAAARAAESQHRSAEAFLLRTRLQKGDFQEGDRIVIVMESIPPKIDTLQLRAGKVLQFIGMSDLSLEGVLRSELADTLRYHLGKYLKNPELRATPLLPIAVFGYVGSPGYYYTAADVVLRDLLMRAGGPGTTGDLKRAVVKRGSETIWNADAVRVALADGLSLDRLHLRAGDEVFVPEKRKFKGSTVLTVVSMTTSLAFVLIRVFEGRN